MIDGLLRFHVFRLVLAELSLFRWSKMQKKILSISIIYTAAVRRDLEIEIGNCYEFSNIYRLDEHFYYSIHGVKFNFPHASCQISVPVFAKTFFRDHLFVKINLVLLRPKFVCPIRQTIGNSV